MSRPKILITGSNGYVGHWLVHYLSNEYDIIGMDESTPQYPTKGEFVPVDLSSDHSVSEAMKELETRCSGVLAAAVHLAAYHDFSGKDSSLYTEVNVEGTRRVLHGLHSFDVDLFIYASTHLVSAPGRKGESIVEAQPELPKWNYPESKLAAERVVRQEHGDVPYVILRIAGIYDNYCHSIPLSRQIQRIYEKRLTASVFPGDLSHGQPFVHIEDVMTAIRNAVKRRNKLSSNLTLFIAEPETLSYGLLQKEFGRLIHDEEWTTREIPKELAKAGAWFEDSIPGLELSFIKPWMIDMADDHYELDITAARNELGWFPQHSLLETLPNMVNALKSEPLRWYEKHGLESIPEPQAISRV